MPAYQLKQTGPHEETKKKSGKTEEKKEQLRKEIEEYTGTRQRLPAQTPEIHGKAWDLEHRGNWTMNGDWFLPKNSPHWQSPNIIPFI